MTERQLSSFVFTCMKNLNLLIIVYISGVTAIALTGYINENSALNFLLQIERMPYAPWKIPVAAILLYCSFLVLIYIPVRDNAGYFVKVLLEICICLMISYLLEFSYTGTVLLILADYMRNYSDFKWRFSFIIIICMLYLMVDYDLISSQIGVTSLETYLGYFQKSVQAVFLGMKNIFSTLNTMLFLLYMIILVRTQMSEKERILVLNERLNTANAELKQANQKLEEYAEESVKNAETKERNRLAREIHDTLGHALTGIITGLDACVTLIDVAPEATKGQLKVIADVARNGMTDVRRSVKALRPDALEKMDLEKALIQMVEEMRKTTSIEIAYQCTTGLHGFDSDEEEIIYRIVQECMTNSIRHGKADYIGIEIRRKYNMLTIRMEDNGIGCKTVEKGFGLHHMQERIDMLHGSLSYNGERGFIVEAQIPIRWGTEEE